MEERRRNDDRRKSNAQVVRLNMVEQANSSNGEQTGENRKTIHKNGTSALPPLTPSPSSATDVIEPLGDTSKQPSSWDDFYSNHSQRWWNGKNEPKLE